MKDRLLFESLHTQYHGMVTQVCLGFVKGDRALADDLSQEIFINVWNALERFRGDASYKTWIYRITVNTCLQYIRRDKSKRNTSIAVIEQSAIHHDTEKEGLRDDLYQAIGRLSEVDRLIIMMVLDELDYEEISRVVGIAEATLRVKIHRIKTRLKRIMEYETGD